MIKVSEAVKQILEEDGFVIESMQRGILNTTAYAKEIHEQVASKTMKPVQLGTIVVSLTRIANSIQNQPSFNPKIHISSMSVTSSLCELTFEKTEQSREKLYTLSNTIHAGKEFYTVTEGLHEITIICSTDLRKAISDHFITAPKVVIDDLVAVSVRFSAEYMDVPNAMYSLMGALATRHINVMEIVSTYTEVAFIVYRNEMEKTIQALNTYSQK